MDPLAGIRYAPEIEAAAREHHIDPRLLAAVAAQETGGPGRDSGANIRGDGGHGRGLFQIDDRWHAFARTAAAMNPARNAQYAAGMIAGLLRKYGDVRKALSAYNSGAPNATGTVTTWADGQRLGYADSVMRHLSRLVRGGELRDELVAQRNDDATAVASLGRAAQAVPQRPLVLPSAPLVQGPAPAPIGAWRPYDAGAPSATATASVSEGEPAPPVSEAGAVVIDDVQSWEQP